MDIVVEATARVPSGGGAAKRLRKSGQVPGIVYGIGQPQAVALPARALARHLQHEAFHSSLLNLKIDGKAAPALLRDVQRHPVRAEALHVDFQLVSADREIAANVPLHFINAELSPGVKLHHGIFTAVETEAAVHCLPRDLPEFIEVDASVMEIGKSVHLSELPAIEGVRFDALTRGVDPVLAAILEPRVEVEETPAAEAVAVDAAAAESSEEEKEKKE